MTSHNYNTRQNSLPSNGNSNPETSELIINLESKLLLRFDNLDKEMLNLKDVIIKDVQVENQRLRSRIINLEKKVISLEENSNSLEQYGRRNNLEITGIPDDVDDQKLEEKVIEILDKIDVNVSSKDVEACHRIGKSKNSSKTTIVRFVNRKHAKKALVNRKGLKNIDKTSIGLEKSHGIFINENLTPNNKKIAFHCRELKRNGRIDKTFSRDGIVQITSKNIENGKKVKVIHMNTLYDRFPDFDFGEDARDDHNDSLQSSY